MDKQLGTVRAGLGVPRASPAPPELRREGEGRRAPCLLPTLLVTPTGQPHCLPTACPASSRLSLLQPSLDSTTSIFPEVLYHHIPLLL